MGKKSHIPSEQQHQRIQRQLCKNFYTPTITKHRLQYTFKLETSKLNVWYCADIVNHFTFCLNYISILMYLDFQSYKITFNLQVHVTCAYHTRNAFPLSRWVCLLMWLVLVKTSKGFKNIKRLCFTELCYSLFSRYAHTANAKEACFP